MSARVFNHVAGRLSLRPPQSESLLKLMRAIEAAPEMLGQERDLKAVLSTLKAEFPTLEEFERESHKETSPESAGFFARVKDFFDGKGT